MPESVTDRCTKSHEYIFLMSKSDRYFFNYQEIQEKATGYDGRKDTMMHGSTKYNQEEYLPNSKKHTMAAKGHERWHWKNLQADGQRPNTMHERRAEGYADVIYPVRNKRDVWSVNVKPFKEAHFATYPVELIYPCILAGCPENGVVYDPFSGSGTTALATLKCGGNRKFIGSELNPQYCDIANKRLHPYLTQYSLF